MLRCTQYCLKEEVSIGRIEMEFRQLGENGPDIPVIGLGAWPIGGGMGAVDIKTAVSTIRYAIDQGVRLVDTAQAYRTSELVLGKALRDGYRERCFLATKVSGGNYSRAAMRKAMDNSLRALDVDYVDLYQIHNWDSQMPLEEQMGILAELRKEGKTRHIGVSNYSRQQLEDALAITRFQSIQPRYNLIDREIEEEILPYCREEGIGVLAHSPLAKGLLTGKFKPQDTFPEDDERSRMERFQGDRFQQYVEVADRLSEIALEKGITLVQLAIAWLLRDPGITCILCGAKNQAQVKDHIGAAGVSFSEDELGRIYNIVKDVPSR